AGNGGTKSNRNSGIFESRPSSNLASSISATVKEGQSQQSPWAPGTLPRNNETGSDLSSRPKSAADLNQMGQWQAPPPSAGLRPNRPPQITGDTNLQSTTITAPTNTSMGLPMSPFDGPSGNWASMVN